jgi:hypothetical protein
MSHYYKYAIINYDGMQINLIPGIFSNGSNQTYKQIFKVSQNNINNNTISGLKGYKNNKRIIRKYG